MRCYALFVDAWTLECGNLSPAAASARLSASVIVLGIALILGVVMAKLGVHWPWRLTLFFPFFVATNSFLQGLYRT